MRMRTNTKTAVLKRVEKMAVSPQNQTSIQDAPDANPDMTEQVKGTYRLFKTLN